MAFLCGKGIWLAHSHDLQRAAEMATHIEGTHLLVKIGHGPIYFPETTRNLITRIRSLGFHPAAWLPITNQAPKQALKAIVEALDMGYEALILRLGTTELTGKQAKPLADALDNVEIPRPRLYIASPPLQSMTDTDGLKTLVPFCQGGWMPLAFGTWGGSAEDVIDREIYQALGDLSLAWGKTPEVYPVLSPASGVADAKYLPEQFIPWIEGITRHGVDFFSIYHTANTEKALWPMLKAVNLTCQESQPSAMPAQAQGDQSIIALPQPVFIVSKAGDTLWGIITRHGLTKEVFWTWNGHLWDDRGLPRDPDYLQEGWRIRVK
jgi:hypothetical protein